MSATNAAIDSSLAPPSLSSVIEELHEDRRYLIDAYAMLRSSGIEPDAQELMLVVMRGLKERERQLREILV